MAAADLPGEGPTGRAESISWLELFFDLVVVAAVAVVAHGLHDDPTWAGLGLTAVVYATIWVGWSLTVLYANVAGEETRLGTMTLVMGLVAVMAASAPVHDEHRADVFVIAFLLLRLVVSRSAMRTGRVLGSWPLLQFGGLGVVWLASIWVPPPATYVVWALALAGDLVLVLLRGGRTVDERLLARLQGRIDQDVRRRARRQPQEQPVETPAVRAVEVDRSHLDERLGLFVIIVLGEVVVQVVDAAAEVAWNRPFVVAGIAAFLMLLGLWRFTFDHGFTGAPHTSLADLPPRLGLPLHLLSTFGLVCVAVGLAEVLVVAAEVGGEEGGEAEVPAAFVLLLAGGLAAYYGVGLLSGLAARAPLRWVLTRSGTATAYCLALLGVGLVVPPSALAWLAALPAAFAVQDAPDDRRRRVGRL